MKTSDFDFELPEELIAQTPLERRDASRLLTLDKYTGETGHHHFYELPGFETRGLPGAQRLPGTARPADRPPVHRRRLRSAAPHRQRGGPVGVSGPAGAEDEARRSALLRGGEAHRHGGGGAARREPAGPLPLPGDLSGDPGGAGPDASAPYIKAELQDNERYQTVYSKVLGSAAAPTAGLHFTPELLRQVEEMGVRLCYVTLHVGLGTFRPVKEEEITDHEMHSEYCMVPGRPPGSSTRPGRTGGG